MITMKSSEAKNNFGFMIDKAIKEPILVKKYNRPYVVIVSIEYFEQLMKNVSEKE